MAKKLLLVILLYNSIQFLNSQSIHDIDSIISRIEQLDDSLKIVKTLTIPYDILVANTDKCIEITENAYKIAKSHSNLKLQADAFYQLGLLYYYLGNYDSTLLHQQMALNIYDSIGDRLGMASIYSQMGYQGKRRNIDWAIETMKKGLKIYREEKSLEGLASTIDNLGVLYEIKGLFDTATSYYLEALEIKVKRNDTVGIPYSLNHLAGINILQRNYKKAEEYLIQSLNIRKERGDIVGLGETYQNLGSVNEMMGKWKQAEKYLQLSIEKSFQANYPDLRRQAYLNLSEVYDSSKLYKKASEMKKLFIDLNDSLLNEASNKKLLELQVSYETEKKEKEILILNEEKALHNLKIARQKNWIMILISVAGIIFSIAIIILLRLRQLEEKRRHKAILDEKEKGIEAVINAQEDERKRIAKDLHDGIGQQLSGLKLSWNSFSEKLNENNKNQIKKLTEILDDACNDVRNISHQMMPRVLGELGLVPAVEDMLNKTFLHSEIKCDFEHYNIDQRFQENIEIGVYRIVQELINNVIKHSKANFVTVQLFKASGHLILIVEDNGKGISINEDFKGHGFLNIATRLDTIHGEVNYEPSPGSGTIATVRIPV